MLKLGFVVSNKQNENRRAILPNDLNRLSCVSCCYIQKGYGAPLHIEDAAYAALGAQMVSREEVLESDIIIDLKVGDADYLDALKPEKILFGWAHALQKTAFTTNCMNKQHTVIAWEEMNEAGRNIFYRNNELAGEAAVLQALSYTGKAPYKMRVAVLGRGNTSMGALRILYGLGATVDVYGSRQEKLFIQKMSEYDMLVICIMWDVNRKDHLILREDIKDLKPGAMIVDVSTDGNLVIEFGHATTIDDPVFMIDGISYYAVDNTPSIFNQTVTGVISKEIVRFINLLAKAETCDLLEEATVIKKGEIMEPKISSYRRDLGLSLSALKENA